MKLFEKLTENENGDEKTLVSVKNATLSGVFICVVSEIIAVFFTDGRSFGLGLLLGGAIAQLLFRQHKLSIEKLMESRSPKRAAFSGYMIRFLIRGAAIFVAIKNPEVNIIGCVIGLLSVPYAIYALAFIDGILNKGGKEV